MQGIFTIYDPGLPAVRPDSSTPARAAAVRIEGSIRTSANETGVFIHRDGTEIVRKSGAPDHVQFSPAELIGTDGTLFTHNHPLNGSFSFDDIKSAILSDLVEVRAVGPTIRHMMRAPSGWPAAWRIQQAMPNATLQAQSRAARDIASGVLDRRFLREEIQHHIWVSIAKKFGLRYERERS